MGKAVRHSDSLNTEEIRERKLDRIAEFHPSRVDSAKFKQRLDKVNQDDRKKFLKADANKTLKEKLLDDWYTEEAYDFAKAKLSSDLGVEVTDEQLFNLAQSRNTYHHKMKGKIGPNAPKGKTADSGKIRLVSLIGKGQGTQAEIRQRMDEGENIDNIDWGNDFKQFHSQDIENGFPEVDAADIETAGGDSSREGSQEEGRIALLEGLYGNKPFDIETNEESRKAYRRAAAEVMNTNANAFRRSCRTRQPLEAAGRFKKDTF